MRDIIESIQVEYERYKQLGERALEQMDERQVNQPGAEHDNSPAVIVRHIAGNLASRFTDFLTTDGEKPWRDRETEFARRVQTRAELMATWSAGWKVLLDTLSTLTDADLGKTVTIRQQPLTVHAALHRSLSHTSYHVGQIVYLGKAMRGRDWRFLSIPPGGSRAYNANPVLEKAPRAIATKQEEMADRLERLVGGSMWHGPSLKVLRDGVTHAQAVARPVAGAHSIAELMRHMMAWADFARQRHRGEEKGDLRDEEDWPPGDPGDEEALRGLWDALDAAHRSLAADVRTLSGEQLGAVVKGRGYIVEDMVRGVVEHGTYHAGQVALLLRALRGPARP